MQAWVTNGGLNESHRHSNNHPVTSTSGLDSLGGTQKRHVYHPQPLPSLTQDNSQPQSRAPVPSANADRNAAATTAGAATRNPAWPSRLSHNRDGSQPMAKTTASSDPPHIKKPAPFWEGSTIEGSLASDTASNVEVNSGLPSHHYHASIPEPSHKQRDAPRRRPFVRDAGDQAYYPPFLIGAEGMIEKDKGPLTRTASTPDVRNHRGGFKQAPLPEFDPDQYSEDSHSQTTPGKASPLNERLHHSQKLPLRTSQRGSFSGRSSFPLEEEDNAIAPTMQHDYQYSENEVEEVPPDIGRLKVKTQEPRRSTIFADADHPADSQPESEDETVEQQPTPKPAKAKPQVARQLFSRNTKARTALHESAMPRSTTEKRQSVSKKRPFELDYDDSALAHMSYTQLKEEPFDFDPAQAEAHSVEFPPRGTLPEKLVHFLDKDPATQQEFFTKMSVKDWDSSGDWFLERFGEVTQRLKEARQKKRETIEKFEAEIADREEAVRNKEQDIKQKLTDLKSKGESLMQNKDMYQEDE